MPSLATALTDRMDFLIARQGVVSGNIANADTPGYLARDISFQSVLNATGAPMQMAATNSGHMSGSTQGATTGSSTSARFIQHNGNAVRLDQEMLKMQESQLNYRFMTQLYSKQVAMQKMALGGR